MGLRDWISGKDGGGAAGAGHPLAGQGEELREWYLLGQRILLQAVADGGALDAGTEGRLAALAEQLGLPAKKLQEQEIAAVQSNEETQKAIVKEMATKLGDAPAVAAAFVCDLARMHGPQEGPDADFLAFCHDVAANVLAIPEAEREPLGRLCAAIAAGGAADGTGGYDGLPPGLAAFFLGASASGDCGAVNGAALASVPAPPAFVCPVCGCQYPPLAPGASEGRRCPDCGAVHFCCPDCGAQYGENVIADQREPRCQCGHRFRLPAPQMMALPSGNLTIPLPGGVKLQLIKIQAGTFAMGSPDGEPGRWNDEKRHQVTLTRDYWLGQYPVTQGQWRAVMGDNSSEFQNGDDCPVERVSWDEARAFCVKLNERFQGQLPEGYRFALPTEAQWEYAARGGGQSKGWRYGGGDYLSAVGWYYENSGAVRLNDQDLEAALEMNNMGAHWEKCCANHCQTHPVGKKAPNELGLYDLSGNVSEWCYDQYGAYPSGAVRDPAGPFTGEKRVKRGGHWGVNARRCRAACRDFNEPGKHSSCIGFRLALAPVIIEPGFALTATGATLTLPGGAKLELIKIKAGTFMMGSPKSWFKSEKGRKGDETPHQVTLTRDYWLGQFPVTQGQWQAVMGNNLSKFPKGDDYPVENVFWDDAQAFCSKLNAQCQGQLPEGYHFALPTEAQWEYACRAGTTTALNNGNNLTSKEGVCPNLDEVAWYGKNSGDSTHPVGQKKPNAWGLYDMHGNVEEWCRDRSSSIITHSLFGIVVPERLIDILPETLFDILLHFSDIHSSCPDYPSGAVTDPVGQSSDPFRVVRGGSYLSSARDCRAASRHQDVESRSLGSKVDYCYGHIGFRLALVPVQ